MIVAEHIDLKVFEGEYLAIVGQNGSGKSTLMKT
ncbi:MAG: ATP-binding cassette domain-containing protein, partial [Selenomonadaceae bacterium]|nr:ATP-binding cassette domain-containing protein [Selenomonadaceae bacterium]